MQELLRLRVEQPLSGAISPASYLTTHSNAVLRPRPTGAGIPSALRPSPLVTPPGIASNARRIASNIRSQIHSTRLRSSYLRLRFTEDWSNKRFNWCLTSCVAGVFEPTPPLRSAASRVCAALYASSPSRSRTCDSTRSNSERSGL